MFDTLPFQIQGIPTLTLYEERIANFEVLREQFPNSAPQLTALVRDLVLSRSISDELNSAPALTGLLIVPPVDRAISDGPINSGPVVSAVNFVLPMPENISENELVSAPGLTGFVYFAPVSRIADETTPINSAPVLSDFTYTPTPGPAPTLNYDGSGDAYGGVILKTLQPAPPDYWEFYVSATGTGDPTTNPGDWSPSPDSPAPNSDGGTIWGSVPLPDYGSFNIIRFVISGVPSLWSNIA